MKAQFLPLFNVNLFQPHRNWPECDLEVGIGQGIWLRRCPWPAITHTPHFVVSLMTNWSISEDKPPTEARTEGNFCGSDHVVMSAGSVKHHLRLWSRHCKRAGDRHDYICSGFNRLYKMEGNTNGIFISPPPPGGQSMNFGPQSHLWI